jgi:hypothetical protein
MANQPPTQNILQRVVKSPNRRWKFLQNTLLPSSSQIAYSLQIVFFSPFNGFGMACAVYGIRSRQQSLDGGRNRGSGGTASAEF